MQLAQAKELYLKIKSGKTTSYREEQHCTMILKVMAEREKATFSAFCVEADISEKTFYRWLGENDLFLECYALGKMYAREQWEAEGRELRDITRGPGETDNKFEYWRMIGWSKFGIGKDSRVRLKLDPKAKPNEHYSQLLAQAADGEFTAGQIKQLMEAINVGLNTHQVFAMQQEIDALRKDLATMNENSNGDNPITDKRA